jgi:hypothetical protein
MSGRVYAPPVPANAAFTHKYLEKILQVRHHKSTTIFAAQCLISYWRQISMGHYLNSRLIRLLNHHHNITHLNYNTCTGDAKTISCFVVAHLMADA